MVCQERICLVEVGGKALAGRHRHPNFHPSLFDEPVVDATQFTFIWQNSEFAQKLHQLMSRQ